MLKVLLLAFFSQLCPRADLSCLLTNWGNSLRKNFILNLPSLRVPVSTSSSGHPFSDWKPAPEKNKTKQNKNEVLFKVKSKYTFASLIGGRVSADGGELRALSAGTLWWQQRATASPRKRRGVLQRPLALVRETLGGQGNSTR